MSESDRLVDSNQTVDHEGPPRSSYGSIQQTPTPPDPDEPMDNSKSTLNVIEKVGFSLGHVYNDLCAGVWFSYTLLFFQGVLGMSGVVAGALVMLGQVGDAICTPIVGFITDRYGTKRKWHMLGTVLVLCTFPLIFAVCPFCTTLPPWWQPLYFSGIILVFQFGWPVVQITHLAMVNELSRTQRDRGDLTASKYSLSVISNVIVYCVTWAVLHVHGSERSDITAADYPKFRVSFKEESRP